MQDFAKDLSEDGELIFNLLLIHQNNLPGHIWGCSAWSKGGSGGDLVALTGGGICELGLCCQGTGMRQRKQPQIVPMGVQLGY